MICLLWIQCVPDIQHILITYVIGMDKRRYERENQGNQPLLMDVCYNKTLIL